MFFFDSPIYGINLLTYVYYFVRHYRSFQCKNWIAIDLRNALQRVFHFTHLIFTCSDSTIATLEKDVKYVQKLTANFNRFHTFS